MAEFTNKERKNEEQNDWQSSEIPELPRSKVVTCPRLALLLPDGDTSEGHGSLSEINLSVRGLSLHLTEF